MNGNVMASQRQADYASESKTVSASTQPKPQLIAALDNTNATITVLEESVSRLIDALALVTSPTREAAPTLGLSSSTPQQSSPNHSSVVWSYAERIARVNATIESLMESLEI